MAGPTDLNRQIGAVRDSMESSIVVLRDRGKRELKRFRRAALIAAGVGAAAGVVLVGLLVVRRVQRPPTRRERIERVIPLGWWDRLQARARARLQAGVARQLPPMQIAIGEEKVKEAHRPRWEATAATVARSLGAGIGSAVATRVATIIFTRLAERGQKQT